MQYPFHVFKIEKTVIHKKDAYVKHITGVIIVDREVDDDNDNNPSQIMKFF